MSVKHIGLVLDHLEGPAPLKLVAIILADHADSEGLCWPSYRKIAERANMTERSVARHIAKLIELGVVVKIRTGTIKRENGRTVRVTNAYWISAKRLLELSPGRLLTDATNVYLEDDTSVMDRWTAVSTKPSKKHQIYNRKRVEPVDNSDRDPMKLDDVFASMIRGDR